MSKRQPLGDYDVGYAKPPTASQFQPGRSGNPSGRKKHQKTAQELLADELNRTVQFMEDGKKIKTTKLGLIVKQIINAAAKGNPKQLLAIIKGLNLDVSGSKKEEDQDPLDSPDDVQTRQSLSKRFRRSS